MKFTLAIINPPYGVGGNLAIKFINKTAEITDDIRAVLPTSVRKPSSLNKIKAHLHCVVDDDLDPSTFPNGISAVKQYWEVRNTSRFQTGVGEIPMMREHPDFEFLPYERRFEADVFVGEYEGVISPNSMEVCDYLYISIEELQEKIKSCPAQFTVWFKIAFPNVVKWYQGLQVIN